MKRSLLTTMVAALYVLPAPLCAAACIESPQPAAVAGHAEPPCHEEAPSSAPPGAPGSHDDCGCQSPDETLTSRTAERTLDPAKALGCVAAVRVMTLRLASLPSGIPHQGDLPPPDLLLLKSTLLL